MWDISQVFIRLLAVATAALVPALIHAVEPIPGQNDPKFIAAVELWLDNDDESSLAMLSAMAVGGNTAARLLLARIERTERSPSEFLLTLDRETRHGLFRGPARGNIHPSWLQIESGNGNPLAELLRRSYSPDVDLDTITALVKQGEPQASDHLVRMASLYGDSNVRETLLSGLALEELHPYVLSQGPDAGKLADGMQALDYLRQLAGGPEKPADVDDSDAREAALFLALGIPFGDVMRDNPWREPVVYWLSDSPSSLPIRNACRQNCSHQWEACAVGILGLTGGYYEAIRQDSPLERIIAQDSFLASKRAWRQALRRASLNRAEHGGELATIDDISARSSCLARHVEAERRSVKY